PRRAWCMSVIDSSSRHTSESGRREDRDLRSDRPSREKGESIRLDRRPDRVPPDAPTRQRRGPDDYTHPGETRSRRSTALVPARSRSTAKAPEVGRSPATSIDRAADLLLPSQFALTGRGRHIVILVENLPVPFDRRPWQIAQTLNRQGFHVSVICPQMYEYTKKFERRSNIDIYRYPNREATTTCGYFCEYLNAMFWMSWFCLR